MGRARAKPISLGYLLIKKNQVKWIIGIDHLPDEHMQHIELRLEKQKINLHAA
jgi:hypothetical protein